tara:strand:- start:3879 stop:4220 length:342 start_codon:yes stop_codon:yes gene_type:complete
MPVSRYENNRIIITSDEEYSDLLSRRDVNSINHYSFKKFKTIKIKDLDQVTVIEHIWQFHDRYFKLASQYYADPTYWWIIAYFNNAPLESDLDVGQTILIPVPLEYILSVLGY